MNTPLPRSTRVELGTTGILTPLHKGATSFWKNQQRFEVQAPVSNHLQQQQISIKEWISTKCAGGPVN